MKTRVRTAVAVLLVGVVAAWVVTAAGASRAAAPTAAPTEIGVKIPLLKAPPRGKTVGFVLCNLPICATFAPYMKSAAAALGWKVLLFTYSGADAGIAMQQAVQKGVDYIAVTGAGVVTFRTALKAALAKHIPVAAEAALDPPNPKIGLYTQIQDGSSYNKFMVSLAQWVKADSKGTAKEVFVNIPDFPILALGEKQAAAAMKAACPTCGFDTMHITLDDLGSGKVASNLVAYLQSHPDVNYVEFSFGDEATGVPQALKAAGLASKVKLLVAATTEQGLRGVLDGSIAAVNVQPIGYQQWLMIDMLARLSVGMKLTEERKATGLMTYVIDTPAAAKKLIPPGYWTGPVDYQAKFKKLWRVK